MPSATPSRLSRIQLVTIPSTDQDRSVAFYEMLGFEKRNDVPWGNGHRWVELYPPNAPTGIALVPPGPSDPTNVQTGIIMNTDDIDATHAQLRALGVDVDESVARVGAPAKIRIGAVEMAGPVPPMFYFRDPDGNSLLIVQPG
jgi:catechol 2,3-dioxygenase-like lactoylglutathione lyase family enzyme